MLGGACTTLNALTNESRLRNKHSSERKLNAIPPTKCAKMTDEHGMLRNGSIDSVGIAGRESNVDSTTTSSSASTTTTTTASSTSPATTTAAITTTTTTSTTTNSVNTNLPNNDGNNNENATTQNSTSNQNDRQSHSPIDTENGNNADHFVNSGSGGGGGGGCASNGNYSTTTGNGSNANSKQPNHSTNYSNSNNGSPSSHNPFGGRLQFFKDGKFILELARSKEGDRGWISVPRKTYWPPAAVSQNNLNNHKNESSTSLSFSDDNSSIQSSPWQRDHSWKQPSPRKNISKDLSLYYYRPIPIILSQTSRLESKRLQRQPNGKRNPLHYVQYAKRSVQKAHLSKIKEGEIECDKDKGKSCESKENNGKDKDDSDIVDSPSVKIESKLADDDEKMDYKADDESNPKLDDAILADDIKSENGTKGGKVESTINRKRQVLRPSKISNVIEKLIARVSEKPVNVTSTQTGLGIHFSSSSRPNDLFHPHQHVSPRKRILREFEKVSLEDRNSSTQKRSRSKSNASTDFANVSNSKTAAGYSIVVAQQTANIACNNKDENNRVANGSPPRTTNSMDVVEKPLKASRSLMSTSASKNSHPHTSSEPTVSQPVSKPISNYSIISLLGHNNSSNNNDSRNETNTDDRGHSESRGSPRSPMSYNHQILSNSRSPYVPKKKSPTNTANALVNSPTNYRNARSPDINSPSPGLQQQNSHHNRYHPASLSSPTSSFHPYLSSSRASPLSSGTLSPTDLYRHRSYRTAGSPSTMSNSSISGLTHQYASLNGSPTAFAPSNRYSPSTYSSSTKTSPGSDRQSSQSHSLSSAYNVSNLLPQTYDGNSSSNVSDSHRYSPNTKQRSSDWSPARTPASCGRGSPSNYANSNNSLSTTTIPKKTASIRQKYGSLSPNGFACGNSNENVTSSSSSVKSDSHSGKKFSSDPVMDAKHLAKRAKTPEQHKKPTQSQELYDKDLQARYNAEVAAMHHQQSLIASALQQQAANPFYHMYAGGNMHGANMPPSMSAAAAAAYMNPLYYHQHPASEIFRKTHPTAAMDLLHQHKNLVPQWMDPYTASMMHYPPGSAQALAEKATLAAKSQNEAHSMLMSPYNLGRSVPARDQPTAADIEMWNVAEHVKKSSSIISSPSAPPSAFSRRQSQQFSDCEPISLIKDEPSSDVPLNLSKH